MKFYLNYLIAFLFIFTISSCRNEDALVTEANSNSINSETKSYEYHHHSGIYINNFSSILGDFSQETDLLDWCIAHGFKTMSLYNVSPILSDIFDPTEIVDETLLKNFVKRAHIMYNLEVTFVAAGASALSKIEHYNVLYPELDFAPNGVTTEYEFWNSPYKFEYYKSEMLDKMVAMDSDFDPSWKQELYISRFEDANLAYTDAEVLSYIVHHLKSGGGNDELFYVDYRSHPENFFTPGSNHYIRIQAIADEAFAQGTVVNFIHLINVGNPTVFNYFDVSGGNHEFHEATENFINGFLTSGINHKETINFKGFQLYKYSTARLARP